MQIEKYLKETQPVIYQVFKNGLESDHLSHAYLLSGNPGTPLLEVAKFLAKSLICDDPTPFACNNCITCLRVDDNNYPDFIVIEGDKNLISKEQVDEIQTQFEKTAFESKGKMIYILHLLENTKAEAINAILKFLEEPGNNVYAFLTTYNENAILPTIISRCQVMRLKNNDRSVIIEKSQELGIAKEDAELLSYFYNNEDLIFDFLQDIEDKDNDDRDNYLKAKDILKNLLDYLTYESKEDIVYNCEQILQPISKDKDITRFFIDLLTESMEDLLSLQQHNIAYLSSLETLFRPLINKFKSIENIMVELLKIRNNINNNVNLSLTIDHIIFTFTKEL